ncbi:glycosyl transferase family 2 [Bacteroides reticulotermitis]|uniref:glycosyl transferase family 2 n=1 Tax=Bacteroides reticulotermitis TaxID=1133319 RepID=UPI001FCB6533|nr:glycosyl transferase family 2 [Bacteroides reticulotermitis]
MDSDDALIENAIELLLDKAESVQADMVVAPFNFIEEGKRRTSDIFEFELMSGIQYLKQILKSEAYWTVWSKFHLRSLYFNNIESLDIAFGEDVVLSSQLLINSDKVVPIGSPIVDYYVYPSSMSHCLNDKAYQDFATYVSWFDDYIKRRELSEELAEELAFFHIKNTITRLHWRKNKDTDREMKRLVEEIQTYPKLTQILSRREKKIVSIYKVSSLLGYLKLLYYSKCGKI